MDLFDPSSSLDVEWLRRMESNMLANPPLTEPPLTELPLTELSFEEGRSIEEGRSSMGEREERTLAGEDVIFRGSTCRGMLPELLISNTLMLLERGSVRVRLLSFCVRLLSFCVGLLWFFLFTSLAPRGDRFAKTTPPLTDTSANLVLIPEK
jgi:hypothetical protein